MARSDDNLPGLGSKGLVPRLGGVSLAKLQLSEKEAYVLTQVDGRTTLWEICLVVPLRRDETLRILRQMRASGVIEIPGSTEPMPSVETRQGPAAAPAIGAARDQQGTAGPARSGAGGGAQGPARPAVGVAAQPSRPAPAGQSPARPAPSVTGQPPVQPAASITGPHATRPAPSVTGQPPARPASPNARPTAQSDVRPNAQSDARQDAPDDRVLALSLETPVPASGISPAPANNPRGAPARTALPGTSGTSVPRTLLPGEGSTPVSRTPTASDGSNPTPRTPTAGTSGTSVPRVSGASAGSDGHAAIPGAVAGSGTSGRMRDAASGLEARLLAFIESIPEDLAVAHPTSPRTAPSPSSGSDLELELELELGSDTPLVPDRTAAAASPPRSDLSLYREAAPVSEIEVIRSSQSARLIEDTRPASHRSGRPADVRREPEAGRTTPARSPSVSSRPPGGPLPRTPTPPLPPEPLVSDDCDLNPAQRRRIDEVHDSLRSLDAFALLGVSPDDDKKTVGRAYFKLSKEFHPDRYFRRQLGPYQARVAAVFQALTEARDILVDEERRRAYLSGTPYP